MKGPAGEILRMTANNIKELRVAFLLTPSEFARRIGIYPEYVARLESGERPLSDLWIDAVVRALGVPREMVTAQGAAIVSQGAKLPETVAPILCPVGARYAILALIAKLASLKIANSLYEDDLADAVQSLVSYVGRKPANDGVANRLSQGLQITVLTILQSRAPDLPEDFQENLEAALPGALKLLEVFSDFGALAPGR